MLKAQYDRRGTPPGKHLRLLRSSRPHPGQGEVLIEVLASPINPADLLALTGDYAGLPPPPAVGGAEGVGRVVEQGPGVATPKFGEMVLLPFGAGAWTTHLVASADDVFTVPAEADPRQLAMLTCNPSAAFLMLTEYMDLTPGQWVIQNAANSAVGNYVAQIASLKGLHTVNIVRRRSVMPLLAQYGADVILEDGEDLADRVRTATDGAGIQLGLDAVAGAATQRLANCMSDNGLIVNYGLLSGERCAISPKDLIFRSITVTGFWRAKWFRDAPTERRMSLVETLAEWIANGHLECQIQATYGLEEIHEAVAAARQSGRNGKIILTPNPSAL